MSPAPSADEHGKGFEYEPYACVKFHPAATALTCGAEPPVESGPLDDTGGTEAEIQAIFRCRIAGLRRLPKRERAQALRAALEWLWFAKAELREKRLIDRYARHAQRRSHMLQRLRPPRNRDLDHP